MPGCSGLLSRPVTLLAPSTERAENCTCPRVSMRPPDLFNCRWKYELSYTEQSRSPCVYAPAVDAGRLWNCPTILICTDLITLTSNEPGRSPTLPARTKLVLIEHKKSEKNSRSISALCVISSVYISPRFQCLISSANVIALLIIFISP